MSDDTSRDLVTLTFDLLIVNICHAWPGAALAGGSRGPDPPATARTTCEIRLNPRTFFRGEGGVSDNAVQNVYTAVCGRF